MNMTLHKTEPVKVTASNFAADNLCLVFSDENDNQYKLDMPTCAMLTLGGLMTEVAHRRQLALASRDN